MISKTEEYALKAVVFLARQGDERPCTVQEIARGTGIPANYLSKILHRLGQHGVAVSERGRHGGFRLSHAPEAVALAEVIAPFGSPADRHRCLLGRRECSDENPCGAHEQWKRVRATTSEFFAETSIADVIGGGADRDPTPTNRSEKTE
ncbi:MAG: Rrf2 family transcriptional regulator [Gemmatimonadota bacterium]|nr:Rrf2 family transcriptional regulator [Gemmatimonadota bacterium]